MDGYRNEALDALSREDLARLVAVYAKNMLALDGVWFQSVERKSGMDAAMFHDVEAWSRFTVTEARRIKAFLGLPGNSGLDGLEAALKLRFNANINRWQITRTAHTLVFRTLECAVRAARKRKGMPLHPCKPAGMAEYAGFAAEIDSRITCRCLSCFPDAPEDGCGCAWEFTLAE